MHTLKIFFSLPFTPRRNETHFYNGHLATAIDDTVYQVFNPKMLKCNFLISRMPLSEWLYGRCNQWAVNDVNDQRYSSVYLYGRGEALRTKIFQIEIRDISENDAKKLQDYFSALEQRYQNQEIEYHPVTLNCSTVIHDAMSVFLPLTKRKFRFLPSRAFKDIMNHFDRFEYSYSLCLINTMNTKLFRLHKFCLGFFFRNAGTYFEHRALLPRKGVHTPSQSVFFPLRQNGIPDAANDQCREEWRNRVEYNR